LQAITTITTTTMRTTRTIPIERPIIDGLSKPRMFADEVVLESVLEAVFEAVLEAVLEAVFEDDPEVAEFVPGATPVVVGGITASRYLLVADAPSATNWSATHALTLKSVLFVENMFIKSNEQIFMLDPVFTKLKIEERLAKSAINLAELTQVSDAGRNCPVNKPLKRSNFESIVDAWSIHFMFGPKSATQSASTEQKRLFVSKLQASPIQSTTISGPINC